MDRAEFVRKRLQRIKSNGAFRFKRISPNSGQEIGCGSRRKQGEYMAGDGYV